MNESWAVTDGHVKADKYAKLYQHYVLPFHKNGSGQNLIKLQYDTVEMLVVT